MDLAQTTWPDAHVLLVDDNIQNLELLEAYLDDLGCRVSVVTGGQAALDAVRAGSVDVMVLDVMMPQMSGFQVCEHLSKMPEATGMPVIMVTALNELGDVERAVECGVADFLTKPVQRQELVARVQAQLAVAHAERQTSVSLEAMRGLISG